jgi:hypothetical protein
MGSVLRIISKAKWYVEDKTWLAEGELQADALTDLRTESNILSWWHIEDDQSNFSRVITALAAGREKPDNFDYAIISTGILNEIGIRWKPTHGDSPDDDVNTKWHRDLYELSAQKLLELARRISRDGTLARVAKKDIKIWLVDGVKRGRLQRDRIKGKMLPQLNQLLDENGVDWPDSTT